MKTIELNNMIHDILTKQAKKTIMESVGNKIEVYHIKSDNVPIDTFDTQEDAYSHLNIYKKNHPGKQFIIEKGIYDSESDMLDKLDQMGEKLDENNNEDMNKPLKVKSLAEAILHAKENNKKKIKIGDESIDVNEYWDKLQEEEGECDECKKMKSELPEGFDEYVKKMGNDMKTIEKDRIVDTPDVTPKKKLKLKESEFIGMITKIVTEAMKDQPGTARIPGLTITKKSQETSKKDSDSHMNDVSKKMKDYLSFDGNDNQEFPNQNGGDKMAVNNTDEQDDTVEDNRGRAMVDLEYDFEPSETFKKRLKDSLYGSTKMGNSHDAANVIPSKLGEKIVKDSERSKKLKKEEPLYHKEPAPITNVNEEVEKMKKLYKYNGVTQ